MTVADQYRIASDITYWFAYYRDKGCPHCGRNLKDMHPEANLFPHFTGGCALKSPAGPVQPSHEQEKSGA